MTFLNPTAAAWAAVALPIVVLYVLRIRRRRQVVPTLMFWEQIFEDTAPRSLWRRMRHWLSLLLQLAFIALLVLALVDPIATSASRRPTHWVVVIDQSASMQATDGDGGGSRLDEAKRFARRVVRAMRVRDQMTIIGAGLQPWIACGRTHHQPTLHDTIEALMATDAPVDLDEAVSLARSIETESQDRRVVLLTDAGGARDLEAGPDDTLMVRRCGGDGANVAITGFAVRPRADNPIELAGMLRIANYTEQPVSAQVKLTADDELLDLIIMPLEPGEEDLRSFPLVNPGGQVLTASLSAEDALAVDNRATLMLPEIVRQDVLLVSRGNLFLQSVLEAQPWMDIRAVVPEEADQAVADADIIIYDEFVPETIPARPCLFLHPASDSRLWTIAGEPLDNPLVSDLAADSDLLHHVNLKNVSFHRARQVTLAKPADELIRSFEHPLLVSWQAASPPVVMLAIDIRQSDLPWRTAFPILLQNTLNHLAGHDPDPISCYRTGEVARVDGAPASSRAVRTDGRAVSLAVEGEDVVVGPVAHAGLIELQTASQRRRLAFNLADSRESDIRPRTEATSQPSSSDSDVAGLTSGWSWPWWVTLTIVALMLSTVEWCLHQRRLID